MSQSEKSERSVAQKLISVWCALCTTVLARPLAHATVGWRTSTKTKALDTAHHFCPRREEPPTHSTDFIPRAKEKHHHAPVVLTCTKKLLYPWLLIICHSEYPYENIQYGLSTQPQVSFRSLRLGHDGLCLALVHFHSCAIGQRQQ